MSCVVMILLRPHNFCVQLFVLAVCLQLAECMYCTNGMRLAATASRTALVFRFGSQLHTHFFEDGSQPHTT
jgi:hypothetical protein